MHFSDIKQNIYALLFIMLIFSYASILHANENPTKNDIRGVVKDMASGEALPYANIILKGTRMGTITNTDGYFVLVNAPAGLCTLQVRYIGYAPKTLVVRNIHGETPLQSISMKSTVIKTEGVTVTAKAEMLDASSDQISQVTFSPRQLSSLPNIGETDVFRAMQLLPGISGASEGESGLYVRGGTPDQNLVLFDGMTIYHVDHFFGFFSAFNADAIKDIQLYKGGFPAEYGGRVSSVVNLTGKTGDNNKKRFGYALNLLSANAYFETPLWNKGTFLIAGRRSYTDFIRSPLYNSIYELMTGESNGGAVGGPVGFGGGRGFGGNQMGTEFRPSFYFYDLNSKLTLNPGSNDIVTLSFYNGKDDLDKSQDFDQLGLNMRGTETNASLKTNDYTKWGNLGLSGKWSRQWNNRFHTNFLAAHSTYFSQYDRSSDFTAFAPVAGDSANQRRSLANATKEDNTVKDLSLKFDADWHILQNLKVDLGFHASYFDNEYTAIRNDSIPILDQKNQSWLYSAYIQNNITVRDLDITLGLRASQYEKTNQLYYEPRASFQYPVGKAVKLKGAWGQYYQFVNRIANEDVTQGARDFWLLADENINPVSSRHFILGMNYDTDNYLFSVEGYRKDLDDVIEFSRRYVSQRTGPLMNFFFGTGTAKGVELLVQKKRGALTGWLGYTLGSVDYTFPELNGGGSFPANHDRLHEVNLVSRYQWGVYSFAATWVYASGSPYTAPESQYFIPLLNGDEFSYIHVSDKNASRLPDYHRLDLSASRRFESTYWQTEVGLSFFNVYNNKNVWYRDYNLDTTPITISDVLMLGFTPTIYLQMKLK